MHVLEIVFLMLREQVSTMHVIQYVCMCVCMYVTVGITTLVCSVHNASKVVLEWPIYFIYLLIAILWYDPSRVVEQRE